MKKKILGIGDKVKVLHHYGHTCVDDIMTIQDIRKDVVCRSGIGVKVDGLTWWVDSRLVEPEKKEINQVFEVAAPRLGNKRFDCESIRFEFYESERTGYLPCYAIDFIATNDAIDEANCIVEINEIEAKGLNETSLYSGFFNGSITVKDAEYLLISFFDGKLTEY